MNSRRAQAVELLLSYPEPVVAESLGVRLKTLLGWMAMPDFVEALRRREADQKRTLARLARQAALNAAAALCEMTSAEVRADPKNKLDPKLLLDILKLSGAYENPEADPSDALADVISRIVSAPGDPADRTSDFRPPASIAKGETLDRQREETAPGKGTLGMGAARHTAAVAAG